VIPNLTSPEDGDTVLDLSITHCVELQTCVISKHDVIAVNASVPCCSPHYAPDDARQNEMEAVSVLTLSRFVPEFVLEHVYEVGSQTGLLALETHASLNLY